MATESTEPVDAEAATVWERLSADDRDAFRRFVAAAQFHAVHRLRYNGEVRAWALAVRQSKRSVPKDRIDHLVACGLLDWGDGAWRVNDDLGVRVAAHEARERSK